MIIGGFQKLSLNEYPGKTCAIIFTRGCNFQCRYCHNPELVNPKLYQPQLAVNQIINFLKSRINKLDAVSITGGEPTLQPDLIPFIKKIKKMGFALKLDSNGTQPKTLETVVNQKLADYLAMDIKAPLEKYQTIVIKPTVINDLKTSIAIIINSGIDHEFRTTIVKELTSTADLLTIAQTIQGAQNYYLQTFHDTKILDSKLKQADTYSLPELTTLAKKFKKYVTNCAVRS